MRLKTQLTIKADFESLPPRAWSRKHLDIYLKERRDAWGAPGYLNTSALISFLLENEIAHEAVMASREYGTKSRYVIGRPSIYGFANSFFKHSYLSHGSALSLHGITTTDRVFVNREQTAKKTTSRLSQKGIDQAFKNQPRRSAFEFKIDDHSITFLNGKHTGNAGVIEIVRPNGEVLKTTSLERTLIDCVVRPQYAGGIVEVARAFHEAKDRVSVQGIATLLKQTKYAYPYHQAIGFLLQRAGLPQDRLQPLQASPMRLNFYLDYGMKQPNLDADWKVFYPSELP